MAKRKKKIWYMHTIHGKPAYFSERTGQIVYADLRGTAPLCASLREIRRDQQRTIAFRQARGFDMSEGKYSYVRVAVPNA